MIGFILGVICFILFIYFLSWYLGNNSTLSSYAEGTTELVIREDSITKPLSVNYTYSVWIYVSEWSSVGTKYIFERGTDQPSMKMEQFVNTIETRLKMTSDPVSFVSCKVENIPLQKWCNLIVTVSDQSLDTYLNGKLVKTCILKGLSPSMPEVGDVTLSPKEGFSGFTAKFKYWSDAMNPQEAWNVYSAGPGGNFLTNFFGSYKLQLNFIKGEDTKASITI